MNQVFLPEGYRPILNSYETQPVSYTHLTLPTKLEV